MTLLSEPQCEHLSNGGKNKPTEPLGLILNQSKGLRAHKLSIKRSYYVDLKRESVSIFSWDMTLRLYLRSSEIPDMNKHRGHGKETHRECEKWSSCFFWGGSTGDPVWSVKRAMAGTNSWRACS